MVWLFPASQFLLSPAFFPFVLYSLLHSPPLSFSYYSFASPLRFSLQTHFSLHNTIPHPSSPPHDDTPCTRQTQEEPSEAVSAPHVLPFPHHRYRHMAAPWPAAPRWRALLRLG